MKIIKTEKWYDPEGLNIPLPDAAFFEGTLDECFNKIAELSAKEDTSYASRIFVKDLGWGKDSKGITRPNHIEIYYGWAQAKEYYRIVE